MLKYYIFSTDRDLYKFTDLKPQNTSKKSHFAINTPKQPHEKLSFRSSSQNFWQKQCKTGRLNFMHFVKQKRNTQSKNVTF